MLGGAVSRSLAGDGARRGPDFAVRRGPRRSRRAAVVRAGAGLVTLLALAALVWWCLTAPLFAIDRIESGAYRFTPEEDLQAAFADFLGRNIWTLGTDEVAARIGALPWVRDVRVVRRLPDGLEVDFREWAPLLLLEPVRIGERLRDRLVLSEDGRVLDFPAHLVLPGLPVLVGLVPEAGAESAVLRLPAGATAAVLDLVAAIEAAGLETAVPVDFLVARTEGYAIVLQDGQGMLLVGREEFGPRLQRYMTARDHLEPGLDYDLRFKDRITVRQHK